MSGLCDERQAAKENLEIIERDLDRAQTGMPDDYLPLARGVVIAGRDMLAAAGYRPGGHRPHHWTLVGGSASRPEGFMRALPPIAGATEQHILRVRVCGRPGAEQFWAIEMAHKGCAFPYERDHYALVFALELLPIWTRTYQGAMHLAEHCYPIPRPPVVGGWIKLGRGWPANENRIYDR